MKRLDKVKGNLIPVLFLVILVAFFIYCVSRPTEISPHFLKNLISLETLDKIIYPIILTPFIVFVLSLIHMNRLWRKSQRTGKNSTFNLSENLLKFAPWFLASIAIVLITSDLIKSSARDQVKGYFDGLPANVAVSVNGQPTKDPNQVINELQKIMPMPSHGSHATKRISVEVTNYDETLRLVLGRDSSNHQEYWVFYPEYRYTSRNEIGRIVTNLFDDY